MEEQRTDVLIVGGGLAGVAAALAAARNGQNVILTEETEWIGGQLTSQGVPLDEHPWIEQFGCTASFRLLREEIREYYRRWYPLTEKSRAARWFNPGAALVSKICSEPRAAVTVLEGMLAPHRADGRLELQLRTRPLRAETEGDHIRSVTVGHLDTGEQRTIVAPYVIDATELGDLLPLAGVEYVTGAESQAETGEPSAPEKGDPMNMQAITWCMAFSHHEGEDHTIDKPKQYDYWQSYEPQLSPPWPGKQISFTASHPRTMERYDHTFTPNPTGDPTQIIADQSKNPGSRDLWLYRRLLAREHFLPGTISSDIVLANWSMQDYLDGPIIEVDEQETAKHREGARQLSLSAFYWLQTEAPRPDGGTGFPGLRLRGDVMGTEDGLAMAPYVRESRRIRAKTTVVEQDLSLALRGEAGAVSYPDSVGLGMYRIDLHPSTKGDNYIDVGSCPYTLPLGALLPERSRNLLASGKNIGTTHITNGAYRLHPTEWNIGEITGLLAAHCLERNLEPHQVHEDAKELSEFQSRCDAEGIERSWPKVQGY